MRFHGKVVDKLPTDTRLNVLLVFWPRNDTFYGRFPIISFIVHHALESFLSVLECIAMRDERAKLDLAGRDEV